MEIVYAATHLVMATCIVGIMYLFPGSDQNSSVHVEPPAQVPYVNRGLRVAGMIGSTFYRLAASLILSYLK